MLTLVDLHTRFTVVKTIETLTANETCVNLIQMFKEIGYSPLRILTDNGSQFQSEKFKNLVSSYGIKEEHSRIYNPRGNSISERINRAINEIMRIAVVGYTQAEILTAINNRLNFVYHRAIGCSPFECISNQIR